VTWLCDGSLEGFLCALYESFRLRRLPERLTRDRSTIDLFEEVYDIHTDDETAAKMMAHLRVQLAPDTLRRILHTTLCDDAAYERELLLYTRLALRDDKALHDLSQPVVFAIEGYEKRLMRVVHRMYGFVRFEMLEDSSLYARIAPPCNVLPLIGRHFAKRMEGERFIIHDTSRNLILVWDTVNLAVHPILEASAPILHAEEQRYRGLWKSFFESVAIEERKNYKAQRNFVPLLYREYMSEFA